VPLLLVLALPVAELTALAGFFVGEVVLVWAEPFAEVARIPHVPCGTSPAGTTPNRPDW
jgi:hypothetical protein